jgi:hypothetical protein
VRVEHLPFCGRDLADAVRRNQRALSITRTSDVPSTIDGSVLIGVVMPKRRAMLATAPNPTSLPSCAATVFFE